MTFQGLLNVLSENVKRLRSRVYLSAEDLADMSKVGKRTVNNLENGFVDPRLSTVYKIAKALGVPAPYLIEKPAAAKDIVDLNDTVKYIDQVIATLEVLRNVILRETEK